MQPRPLTPGELADGTLRDVDGAVESREYLHLTRDAAGSTLTFTLERRPLREPRTDPNGVGDELRFTYKQVTSGVEEGEAAVIDLDGLPAASALAVVDAAAGVLDVRDLRVDVDRRRQGLGTVLLLHLVNRARELDLRAVRAAVRADNVPLQHLLEKVGFDLAGFDEKRHTNHDLVKEAATLLYYYDVK